MSAILKSDFQKREQLRFSGVNYLNYTKKDPILHVATTFSLKQGETKTSHGPIPHPLIHHLQDVNFLKNWFWTLIFLVKIEWNLIFLWNEFLVKGLKIPIQRILIFLITLLLVCLHAHKIPKFTYSLLNENCLSNRDTDYLIAEKVFSYILFLVCYYF